MTREEALKLIDDDYTDYLGKEVKEWIAQIYASRAKEICDNCTYFIWGPWDNKIDSNRYCRVNRHCTGFDYEGYGCNKWEAK